MTTNMQAEVIRIRNFGPIKDVEIVVKPLTIFIGESGSGKSTILKVLSMFRWIYKRVNLHSYLAQSDVKRNRLVFRIKSMMKNSGLDEYLSQATEIDYERGSYKITLRKERIKHDGFISSKDNLSIEKVCFISDKRSMLADFLVANQWPPTYYLQDTLDNFVKAVTSLGDGSKARYLDMKLKVDRTKPSKFIVSDSGGSYSIAFSHSSSGAQNALPLTAIAEYYSKVYSPRDGMTTAVLRHLADIDSISSFSPKLDIGSIKSSIHLLIEEPELSLFPTNQVGLIRDLVDKCFHANRNNMTLALATHSPYILTAVNNMILAGDKGQAGISFDDIAAYNIEKGQAKSIMDDESRLMDAETIDGASIELEDEFDGLMSR